MVNFNDGNEFCSIFVSIVFIWGPALGESGRVFISLLDAPSVELMSQDAGNEVGYNSVCGPDCYTIHGGEARSKAKEIL